MISLDPRTIIDEGYQFYIQSNLQKALYKYNEALNIAFIFRGDFSEAVPEALYYRGFVYKQLNEKDRSTKDFSIASRILEDIVQKSQNNLDAKNYLGLVYLELNKCDKAKNIFDKIIRDAPGNSLQYAKSFRGKGKYYYQLGNYQEALNVYEKALIKYLKILGINRDNIKPTNKVSRERVECATICKAIGNCYYLLGNYKKNYQEALKYYDEGLKIYPSYADIHYNKGIVFAALNKHYRSIECYEKALDIAQGYYLAHNNKGYMHYKCESYEKALQAFDQCLKCENNHGNALSNKGITLLRLGRYKEAIDVLNSTKELYPDFDEAWYHIGSLCFFLEQYDEAQKAFKKVIDLNKEFVIESWGYKGVIFAKCNNYEEAIESFSKGKKKIDEKRYSDTEEPQYLVPLMLRESYVSILYGEYQRALDTLNSIKLDSINNVTHILTLLKLKGIIYEKLSDNDCIENNFKDTLSKIENMLKDSEISESYKANIHYERGIILRRQGNYNESIKAFKETLKENPAHFLSMNELGIAYRKSGEPYKALKAFENAVKENENYYEAWINKALVLRGLANNKGSDPYNEKSRSAFEKAMKILEDITNGLNENYSVAHYHMGLIHYDLKEYEEAITCFEKAAESKEYYEDAKINQGLSHFYLKKYDEAIDVFDQIVDTKLNNGELYHTGLHYNCQELENAITCFKKTAKSKEYCEDTEINKESSSPIQEHNKVIDIIDIFDQIDDTEINNKELMATLLNNKGTVLLCQGKYNLANKYFTRAANLDKRNLDSKNNIGLLNYYRKEYRRALDSFKEAIEGEKNGQPSADALNNKGILLFKRGEVEEAKEAFNKAISISPEYSSVRKNKGIILCKLGEHEEALKTFKEALYVRPEEWEIHTLLAGSLLKLGDIQGADKEIKEVLEEIEEGLEDSNSKISSHEKCNAYNIDGQIKIEKLDYEGAINSFEKAISYNPSNLSLLVWDAYAKYLKVEFLIAEDQNQIPNNDLNNEKENPKNTNPINKKYQEGIASVIRDLERISLEFDKKQESINFPLFILLKEQTLMKTLGRLDLLIYGAREPKETGSKNIRGLIKDYNSNINLSILEHDYEKITEEKMIEAYIFYFTGFLYYKIDDLYLALNRLKKCVNKKCGPNIEDPAKKLIQDIWEYKIRPPFWRWWLYSPINTGRKRIIFGILSISFFCVLFPSFTLNLVSYLTYFLTFILPGSLKNIVHNINSLSYSFFNSIAGTIQYIILTLLVFLLLFPSIQHIKSKDFEVDLNTSPAPFVDFCPLTPDFTPEKSTTLMHINKRPKPLEIHNIRDQTSLETT